MLILIYYNPNRNSTYHRLRDYLSFIYNEKLYVGYENLNGHILIQIIVINENGFFNVVDYFDFKQEQKERLKGNKRNKFSFINRFRRKE